MTEQSGSNVGQCKEGKVILDKGRHCKLLKTILFGRSWTESATEFPEGELYKYPE